MDRSLYVNMKNVLNFLIGNNLQLKEAVLNF